MNVLPTGKNSFQSLLTAMAVVAVIFLLSCCAYRHYLGLHGPSVKKHPLVHADVKADRSCLVCHGPGSTVSAPKTSHANFKGCLKCHNDEPTAGS